MGKEKLNAFCQNKHGTKLSPCGLQPSARGKERTKLLHSQITEYTKMFRIINDFKNLVPIPCNLS